MEEAQFFDLYPGQGQSSEDFVLKVESQRKIMKISDAGLEHVFMNRLSNSFKQQLETARQVVALSAGSNRSSLKWADVVRVARDAQYAIKCVSKAAPAQVPATLQQPTAQQGAHAQVNNNKGSVQGCTCDYCTDLQVGMNNHPVNKCYIDPKSPMFKPEVRQRRLQACLNKGLKIPERILKDGHFTPNAKTTASHHLSEGEINDLVAALQLTGAVQPEEAEQVVEKFVGMTASPDLIQCVEHISEGTDLLGSVGSEDARAPALDRLMNP